MATLTQLVVGVKFSCVKATFATRPGADGHDIRTIMVLMGHEDPNTCMRYVRATEPAKRAAVQSAFIRAGHKIDTRHLVAVQPSPVSC